MSLVHELREVLKGLRAAPQLSLLVVLTLGLGLGLVTTGFTVVDHVLLRPVDLPDSDRLVLIGGRLTRSDDLRIRLASGDLDLLRAESQALEDVAAWAHIRQNMAGGDLPALVQVGWTTPNLFDLLGLEAELGRLLEPGDGPGRAVLSEELWRRAFGADPDIVGGTISLDGHSYDVVGVLGDGVRIDWRRAPVDVWKSPDDWWQNGDVWDGSLGDSAAIFRLVGKLRPGVEPAQLDAELTVLAERRLRGLPSRATAGFEYEAGSILERTVGDVQRALWLLFLAVGFVLLVACANVTNLFLVRARARERELALRAALGCGRAGLLRLVLGESLVLALAGGALGLAVAAASLGWLRGGELPSQLADLPRLESAQLDLRVGVFAFFTILVCAALAGMLPAWTSTRASLRSAMGARGSGGGPGRHRVGWGLVALQIGLCVMLLVGVGLVSGSLDRLEQIDPGFDAADLLTFSYSLPGARYEWPAETHRFFADFVERVEAVPGVESVAMVQPLPLTGEVWSGGVAAGAVADPDEQLAQYRLVTPGAFDAVRTRMLEGRTFTEADPRLSVVVNRRAAERLFPGESALGRELEAIPWGGGYERFRVVGIVDDLQYGDLRDPLEPTVYFDARHWSWADWEVQWVLRYEAGDPLALLPQVREVLASMDPQIPLADARTMTAWLDDSLSPQRVALVILGVFALVALALAVVGIYGVVSYMVAQRRREMAIRVALGSAPASIWGLLVGQVLRVALIGVGFGVLGALAGGRLLEGLLWGVSPRDPSLLVAVVLVLLTTALLACAAPARAAARRDPIEELRSD